MRVVELHPEDLLDRARRGQLDEVEKRRLDSHLERCEICALELEVAGGYDLDGLPTSDDDALLARVSAGALATLGYSSATVSGAPTAKKTPSVPPPVPEAVRAASRSKAPPPRRRTFASMRWGAALAAAALLLATIGGTATAAWWVTKYMVTTGPIEILPMPKHRPVHRVKHPKVAAPVPVAPAPEVVEAPMEAPESIPTPPKRHKTMPTAPPMSAGEMLVRADEARRDGLSRDAVALYRELQERYPNTREDDVSHVSLGRLLLDRMGNARAALGEFDAYLGALPNGTLAEEARVGRALALERMGRTEGERAAWHDLLEHHPNSPHVARARERLTALGE